MARQLTKNIASQLCVAPTCQTASASAMRLSHHLRAPLLALNQRQPSQALEFSFPLALGTFDSQSKHRPRESSLAVSPASNHSPAIPWLLWDSLWDGCPTDKRYIPVLMRAAGVESREALYEQVTDGYGPRLIPRRATSWTPREKHKRSLDDQSTSQRAGRTLLMGSFSSMRSTRTSDIREWSGR